MLSKLETRQWKPGKEKRDSRNPTKVLVLNAVTKTRAILTAEVMNTANFESRENRPKIHSKYKKCSINTKI